jgi:hypothetical protein
MRTTRLALALATTLAVAATLTFATSAQAADPVASDVIAADSVTAAVTTTAPAKTAGNPAPVNANDASGNFFFTTSNGIAPTWFASGITLSGISPGSALSNSPLTRIRVSIPVVAKLGTANFAAGGFKIQNIKTREFVNCQTPVIDTRAKVIDCVLKDGTNARLFAITSIATTKQTLGVYDSTNYRGMKLQVADQRIADFLNDELSVNLFSPSVTFALAQLTVTSAR